MKGPGERATPAPAHHPRPRPRPRHSRRGPAPPQSHRWHEALAAFLAPAGCASSFYWCFNPNSGDTGGLLLDGWGEIDTYKAGLLARVCPHPTRFEPHSVGAVPPLEPAWTPLWAPAAQAGSPAGGPAAAQAAGGGGKALPQLVAQRVLRERWDRAGETHYLYDCTLSNSGDGDATGVRVGLRPSAAMCEVWCLQPAAAASTTDDGGMADGGVGACSCYELPGWSHGQLAPGQVLTWGCITTAADFQVEASCR